MADPARGEAVGAALARYYDLDLTEDPGDVELYLALAEAGPGPILELAAGSGRISVPLAAAGHEVVAIDNDAHMLERARARWAATTHPAGRGSLLLTQEDMTTYRPGARFGLALIGLNSLLLLSREGQRAALEAMAGALVPGGRVAIDVWLPAPDDLVLYDGRLVLDWVRRDEEAGEWVAKTTSARYSSAARSADITSFFDAWSDDAPAPPRRTMRSDRISFTTAHELIDMFQRAGLALETLGGDYDMNPFADDSDRLVLVGRRGTD